MCAKRQASGDGRPRGGPPSSFAPSPVHGPGPVRRPVASQTLHPACRRWGLKAMSMAKKGKGGAGRASGKNKSPKVRADALLVKRGLAAVGTVGKSRLATRSALLRGLIEGIFQLCQHANEALALILKRAVVADEGKIIVDKVLAKSLCAHTVAPALQGTGRRHCRPQSYWPCLSAGPRPDTTFPLLHKTLQTAGLNPAAARRAPAC